jgi:hypothetical protein
MREYVVTNASTSWSAVTFSADFCAMNLSKLVL